MLLGTILRLYSEIFVEIQVLFPEILRFEFVTLFVKHPVQHVKNRHFSRHFETLPIFSGFYFLTDFDASKSVLRSFFAFFAKI